MKKLLLLVIVLMIGWSKLPSSDDAGKQFGTVFIGALTVTAYRSVVRQTDKTPWITSIGERVTVRGCAVSQDMLAANGGPFHYGDLLYIDQAGFRFVNDTMNGRIKQAIDLWVPTISEEKKVFAKFKNGKTKIWIVVPRGI